MAYSEDILKLRARFADAVRYGVISEDGKSTFEAVLLQIMNDAEKNRQNCVSQADNLRKQAAVLDGQAGGFASTASIIYNVLNGYVTLAEREAEREAEEAAEKAAALAAEAEELGNAEESEKKSETTVDVSEKINPSELVVTDTKKKSSRKK